MQAEPLNGVIFPNRSKLLANALSALILRFLYKIRTLSEQGPLDGPSFTYITAFLRCVVHNRDIIGIGDDEDEPLERMVLVIDITNLHAAECEILFNPERGMRTNFTLRSREQSIPEIKCSLYATQHYQALSLSWEGCFVCFGSSK